MSAKTVKFIPIKHGDAVELSDTGIVGVSGSNKLVGFKPGRAGKREGWLVMLVSENGSVPHRKMRRPARR